MSVANPTTIRLTATSRPTKNEPSDNDQVSRPAEEGSPPAAMRSSEEEIYGEELEAGPALS
jgi:hypothetical protein